MSLRGLAEVDSSRRQSGSPQMIRVTCSGVRVWISGTACAQIIRSQLLRDNLRPCLEGFQVQVDSLELVQSGRGILMGVSLRLLTSSYVRHLELVHHT